MSKRLLSGVSDYVIFTSSNGIKYSLINAEKTIGKDEFISALNKIKVVSIGKLTENAGLIVDIKSNILPKTFSSEGLIEEFDTHNLKNKTVEILRSSHGSKSLTMGLEKLGAIVNDICVYNIQMPKNLERPKELINRAVDNEIDIFTFTSTMTVVNFFKIAEIINSKQKLIDIMNKKIVAAIGIPTRNILKEYGIKVKIMPEIFTFEEMIKEINKVIN